MRVRKIEFGICRGHDGEVQNKSRRGFSEYKARSSRSSQSVWSWDWLKFVEASCLRVLNKLLQQTLRYSNDFLSLYSWLQWTLKKQFLCWSETQLSSGPLSGFLWPNSISNVCWSDTKTESTILLKNVTSSLLRASLKGSSAAHMQTAL